MKQILLACLVVLATDVSYAATYYVAKNGDNGYTCAQARSVSMPKRTVAAGLSCLASGDTLTIKAGNYGEFIDHNQIPAGMPSAHTTVQAVAGEAVILEPSTGGRAGNAVWLYHSYITLDGLVVDAAKASSYGIRINNGASHLVLRNMEVKNARGNCIGIQYAPSKDVQIINSKLHHCGTTDQDHGIYLKGSNHVVEHNEIYNNSGHGVHLWNKRQPNNDNNVIRYNHIYNNGSRGILIGSGTNNVAYGNVVQNNGSGITIGFNGSDKNRVYDNKIYSNRGSCAMIRPDSTNASVNNNVCWQNRIDSVQDSGSKSIISNNSVVESSADAIK
jgi:parallel beta-helix repeat protein